MRSFNKRTAHEGVIRVRKPQREDSYLGLMKASPVPKGREARPGAGVGRREPCKEAALGGGCLWSRDTASPGGPQSGLSTARTLPEDKGKEALGGQSTGWRRVGGAVGGASGRSPAGEAGRGRGQHMSLRVVMRVKREIPNHEPAHRMHSVIRKVSFLFTWNHIQTA